jgi:hypothetical protein
MSQSAVISSCRRSCASRLRVALDSTALDWHAIRRDRDGSFKSARTIDGEELRPSQVTPDEITKHQHGGLDAFRPHTLDRGQHLLTVLTHADDNQQRGRGRFAPRASPNDSAVEDQSHDRLIGQRAGISAVPIALQLAPHPAHGVHADSTSERSTERPPKKGPCWCRADSSRRSARRRPSVRRRSAGSDWLFHSLVRPSGE